MAGATGADRLRDSGSCERAVLGTGAHNLKEQVANTSTLQGASNNENILPQSVCRSICNSRLLNNMNLLICCQIA